MTNKNPAALTEYTPGAKCSVCGLTVWSNGDTADARPVDSVGREHACATMLPPDRRVLSRGGDVITMQIHIAQLRAVRALIASALGSGVIDETDYPQLRALAATARAADGD